MEIRDKQSPNGMLPYLNSVSDVKTAENNLVAKSKGHIDKDKVILSPGAREVQEALRIAADEPDIRSEKVSEIKEQVQNGVYHFDGRKIAMK
jgi:flagellar biosynthesis anti-sigma factor FlgM